MPTARTVSKEVAYDAERARAVTERAGKVVRALEAAIGPANLTSTPGVNTKEKNP
jgi:hypothetical protein